MDFDLKKLKEETTAVNRYEKRLSHLVTTGQEIERIKNVVETAIENTDKGQRSFVIYGEPQSGKTEMMIALTAKLLDDKHQIVVILLNDSVQLLGQNLERFQRAGLSPSPKKFSEILTPEINIGERQWIIFCKKNAKDLHKLIQKIELYPDRVIIDDEADYATPNSKINQKKKSKINELTENLIGETGIYIGVTATPARLDLNRTHQNQNEYWIDFPPHSNYVGQDIFFPALLDDLKFQLSFLPDTGDIPKHLRDALFSFLIRVAFLNIEINDPEQNYSLLIHTSGRKNDHIVDYKQIIKIFEALRDDKNKDHESYYKDIWEKASHMYPDKMAEIVKYIITNCDRNNVVVMNSDKEVNVADNRTATDPSAPFTIIIGGNIVSRGVTFNNLLSMFFTRDVKHKLQQDTYIQRARMFGSRKGYLKYFELIIPKTLYLDWQRCFIFHRLSLEARKQNNRTPVWLDGERITASASSSIDKTNILVDRGEMSFDLFDYEPTRIQEILEKPIPALTKVKALSELLGKSRLPDYLINYMENFCPSGDDSIAVHSPKSIAGYADKEGEIDKATITRTKGFIGDRELEETKHPNAIHHINILFNDIGKARVFYKYKGSIRFLRTSKKND
ncbi:DEAD/DEAH box helicase family protein [Patescibacteria group bacterium]|nr:DEAD/DEAH box helicase family protein [Patescibacteria group bacterium]